MEKIYLQANLQQTGVYDSKKGIWTNKTPVTMSYIFSFEEKLFEIPIEYIHLAVNLMKNKDKNIALLNKNHKDVYIRKICKLILKGQLDDYELVYTDGF